MKTRWLTADEQRVWRAFIHAVKLLGYQLDKELLEDAGIPHSYYEILVALSEAPERKIRMTDLAELTKSSKSRLSHAVERLEELGWVRRQACRSDRRGQEAVLTNKGFRVLGRAAPGHVEGVRRHLFDRLSSAQVKQLGQIMESVRDGLITPEIEAACQANRAVVAG